MRPTDHVDISAVETSARAYIVHLFVEDYVTPARIAALSALDLPVVETVLDVYGGKAHRDRLRVSLEELRTQVCPEVVSSSSPEGVRQQEPAPVESQPKGRRRKWLPDADGRYPCPDCSRVFDAAQGVGRHCATVHPGPGRHRTDEPASPVEHEDEPDEGPDEGPTDEPDDEKEVTDDPAPGEASTTEPTATGPRRPSIPLSFDQSRRVLALAEARSVLETRQTPGVFTALTGSSRSRMDVTELLRVADWIVTGGLTPDPPPSARSSITTGNVQILLKAEADLMALGYDHSQARQAVERLVDRLVDLDRARPSSAAAS